MSERTKEELLSEIEQKLAEKKIDRREFGKYVASTYGAVVSTSVLATAADAFFAERASALASYLQYEAIIIGSGVGGSVLAARLSKKWPGKVLLIERGKKYPKGSFTDPVTHTRTTTSLSDMLLRTQNDDAPRMLDGNILTGYRNGVFDMRSFRNRDPITGIQLPSGIDILAGNGYGGGTLVYANAIIEPCLPDYDADWPATIKDAQLAPYRQIFKQVIQARPVPQSSDPARVLNKQSHYQNVATLTGGTSALVDISVFFGNDYNNPVAMGVETANAHGKLQASCEYCSECILGCDIGAKNSTDQNYLYKAESYGMTVLTEKRVDKIVALNALGWESLTATGSNGYKVYFHDTLGSFTNTSSATAQRVILAAGSMGTTEILMRNKTRHLTLRGVSNKLGETFSSNGDFIGMVVGGQGDNGQAYGPTMIQRVKYDNADPTKQFIMEDVSLPSMLTLIDWILDLSALSFSPWQAFWQTVKDTFLQWQGQDSAISGVLMIGRDASDGKYVLESGALRLSWWQGASNGLYTEMQNKLTQFATAVGGMAIAMPTMALGRSFTVHPLGGAKLGTSAADGVTSSALADFGRVYGYNNLFVADGALIPSSVGVNPSMTIGALAELVAKGITGVAPTTTL